MSESGQYFLVYAVVCFDEIHVQALACSRNGGLEMWIANLTSEDKTIDFGRSLCGTAAILSLESFETATKEIEAMILLGRPFADRTIILGPYAVARLCVNR